MKIHFDFFPQHKRALKQLSLFTTTKRILTEYVWRWKPAVVLQSGAGNVKEESNVSEKRMIPLFLGVSFSFLKYKFKPETMDYVLYIIYA